MEKEAEEVWEMEFEENNLLITTSRLIY